MCVACAAGGAECPACRALKPATGFPFDEGATLEQLLTHALDALKREWQACVIAALLYVVIIAGGAVVLTIVNSIVMVALMRLGEGSNWSPLLFQSSEVVRQLLMLPLQCIASLGLMRTMLDVVMGRSPGPGRFFSDTRLLPGAIAIQLPLALALSLPPLVSTVLGSFSPTAGTVVGTGWSCLFLPALFVFGLSWWLFSVPELLISDCGALEAMRRAFSLGRPWKNLRVLGYGALAGIVVVAGAMACGVGVLLGLPFGALIMLSLFLAMRSGSGLPAPGSL